MRRRDFKSRREAQQAASASQAKYVENAEIIVKLLMGQPYSKEDLSTCASSLMEKFGYNTNKNFFIFDTIQEIPVKNLIKTLNKTSQPIFVFYLVSKNHWALCCWINSEDILVLHKDSKCQTANVNLERQINSVSKRPIQIIYHQNVEQNDNINSGPIAIRNLKIMLEECKKDDEEFVDNFETIKFCTPEDIVNIKKSFVYKLAKEIATNTQFLAKLNEFINDIPLKLHDDMLTYKQIIDEELNKNAEDFDEVRVETAKNQYLVSEEIKEFQKKYKFDKKANRINLETEFPTEMKNVKLIFSVLEHLSKDEYFFNVLTDISEILEIENGAKVLEFYKLQTTNNTEETSVPKPENSEYLDFTIPDLFVHEEHDANCTSFNDLMQEIDLGESSDKIKPVLHKKFCKVQKFYVKFKKWTVEDISKWVESKQGKLKIKEELCEAIAVLNRGYWFVTGGGRFRHTQVLAALVFFQNTDQGQLVQIQTGEGKTVIIAILAIIRALEGCQVDVITSNPVLAQDAVDEMRNFYHLFQISVATNNASNDSATSNDQGDSTGYTSKVLYGTISNFQFDFLRECIEEVNIRAGRNFDQVILDEVDSMLVDNGGYLAKISSPFPGMASLKYVYIKIWQELVRAEHAFQEHCEKILLEEIQELKGHDHDEAMNELKKTLEDLYKSERKFLMDFIKESNPTRIKFIPKHLRNYTEKSLEIWIQNAIRAKYDCHEFHQYRIAEDDDGEKVIVPVDYMNTGVTLKNTIWSNGLHQFIQLKHNIHLTYESVTSSFISNIGYIKKYENSKIFGLSGTLGSSAEQKLLSSIYNVTFARIPTYKPKKFHEVPMVFSAEEEWETKMVESILKITNAERAVLVICETEADLRLIREKFDFPVRIFANEDNVDETKSEIKPGDIVLATNIAGRGTDFKTSQDLEDNGGLHVIVGFLPCNQRVEDQAFGRTSRQGNNGSAQLVIRESALEDLELRYEENMKIEYIKHFRDKNEKARLKKIRETLVKELHFKDELFLKFTGLFSQLQKTNIMEYVLQDLKEFWAFWLDLKDYKGDNLPESPQEEFDKFVEDAEEIIGGSFKHNPYYCILQADDFLAKQNFAKARSLLTKAIEMSSSKELNAAAYMKLFQIEIKQSKQFSKRIVNTVKHIFFLGDSQSPSNYKINARMYLKKAHSAISKEIAYVRKNFIVETRNGCIDFVEDFRNILDDQPVTENLFFKHINSRVCLLEIYSKNIEELLEVLEKDNDVIINGEMEVNLENIGKESEESRKFLTNSEVSELQSIGLEAVNALKPLKDFPSTVIHGARFQLIEGVGALAAGLCFPPIFPVMGYYGGTCIAEAITDVAIELISQGQSEFNKSRYIKEKCISQAVSVVTLGISVVTQGAKILQKAVQYCEKISEWLRKCPYFKSICSRLANLVDRLKRVFQLFLKSRQLTNKIQKTTDVLKLITVKVGKDVGTHLCKKHVVKPLLQAVSKSLLGDLKKNLNRIIAKLLTDNKALLEKLRVAQISEIFSILDKLIVAVNNIEKLFNDFIKMIEEQECDLVEVFNMTMTSIELGKVMIELFEQLKKKLVDDGADNNLVELISRISERISRQIVDSLSEKLNNLVDQGKKRFFKEGNMFEDVLNLTRNRNEILSTIGEMEDEANVIIDILKDPKNIVFEEISNLIALAVKRMLSNKRIHATSADSLFKISRDFSKTLKRHEKSVKEMVQIKNKILGKLVITHDSIKSIITHLKNNVVQTERISSIDFVVNKVSKHLTNNLIKAIDLELLSIIEDLAMYFNSNIGICEMIFNLIRSNPVILNFLLEIKDKLAKKLRKHLKSVIANIISEDESLEIILIRINVDELKPLLEECVEVAKPIKEVYKLTRELHEKLTETLREINKLTNNVIKSLNNLIRDEGAPPRKEIKKDKEIVEKLSQEIATAIMNIIKKAI